MSESILAAIISAVSGIIIALIGAWVNTRSARKHDRANEKLPASGQGAAFGHGHVVIFPPVPGYQVGESPSGKTASSDRGRKRFWFTGPGVLVAVGMIFVGIAGLIIVTYATGLFGKPPSNGSEPTEDFEEYVRRNVKPRATWSRDPVEISQGQKRYKFTLWIEAPPEIMSQINKVYYDFASPRFDPPKHVSSNRNDGFSTSYVGEGAWWHDIDVILVFQDGRQVTLKFNVLKAING